MLDLDVLRAQRAEAAGHDATETVKFGGREYAFRTELPVLAGDLLSAGNLRDGLATFLVDPAEVDDLLAAGFSVADLEALVATLYGVDMGESKG